LINVLFLTHGPELSVRQRVTQILPHLKSIRTAVRPAPGMFLPRDLGSYDVVFWQRRLPPRWLIRKLTRRARTLVFEFDEPLFLDLVRREVRTSRPRLSRFAAMVEAADTIVVPNQYLAGFARKFTDDWRIKILPTGVDLSRWARKTEPRRQHKIVVGWVGSSADLRHLESLETPLSRLQQYFPILELRVVSDRAVGFKEVKVGCKPLDEKDLVEHVTGFDIALAPYVEDAHSMGQFPWPIPHYMAVGLPVVASDSINVRPLVQDHVNGLLATAPEEWEKRIGLLIEAPDLGTKLGEGARRTAEKVYALNRIARGYLSVLEATFRLAGASSG
jgi:glycosyltransferase involved in cell wall biosynthesis